MKAFILAALLAFSPFLNSEQAPDKNNIELSINDFVHKISPYVSIQEFLVGCNLEVFTPSKYLTVTAGTFISLNDGLNDLSARVNGFYTFSPDAAARVYACLTGASGISLSNGAFFADGEAKLGGELKIDREVKFIEGGAALRVPNGSLHFIVNSGIRAYLF